MLHLQIKWNPEENYFTDHGFSPATLHFDFEGGELQMCVFPDDKNELC